MLILGCQTPMDTPEKNLMAFMDATGIFERYPINEEMLMMED